MGATTLLTIMTGWVVHCAGTPDLAAQTRQSNCGPVEDTTKHPLTPNSADPFPVGQRLARIEKGKVPCLHGDSGKADQCAFRTVSVASGHWLEDKQGRRYAQVG